MNNEPRSLPMFQQRRDREPDQRSFGSRNDFDTAGMSNVLHPNSWFPYGPAHHQQTEFPRPTDQWSSTVPLPPPRNLAGPGRQQFQVPLLVPETPIRHDSFSVIGSYSPCLPTTWDDAQASSPKTLMGAGLQYPNGSRKRSAWELDDETDIPNQEWSWSFEQRNDFAKIDPPRLRQRTIHTDGSQFPLQAGLLGMEREYSIPLAANEDSPSYSLLGIGYKNIHVSPHGSGEWLSAVERQTNDRTLEDNVKPDPTRPSLPCRAGCNTVFHGKDRIRNELRHWSEKHENGPKVYRCEGKNCDKTFNRSDSRLKHHRHRHPELETPPPKTKGNEMQRTSSSSSTEQQEEMEAIQWDDWEGVSNDMSEFDDYGPDFLDGSSM